MPKSTETVDSENISVQKEQTQDELTLENEAPETARDDLNLANEVPEIVQDDQASEIESLEATQGNPTPKIETPKATQNDQKVEAKTPILKRADKKKKKSALREILEAVVIALVLALFIKAFVLEMFTIPTRSMEHTLDVNDRVVVTKFSYWFNEPKRGEVIVFKYPGDPTLKTNYVKRLIGLPGEVVEFKDSKLYIDGVWLEEPYLPMDLVFEDFGPVTVPKNSYFMCGDNRNNSSDSRVWGFVKQELIVGKGQCIYWPLDRLGGL